MKNTKFEYSCVYPKSNPKAKCSIIKEDDTTDPERVEKCSSMEYCDGRSNLCPSNSFETCGTVSSRNKCFLSKYCNGQYTYNGSDNVDYKCPYGIRATPSNNGNLEDTQCV